tara:strand:+ start:6839 stop:8305 length:1467 start_codon:yes stop_codon:yes gene_type:complete
MILPEVFFQLRDKAIDDLDEVRKLDSFGYHIDVTDSWENIYNTTELLAYLSIHNTHAAKYHELSFHMKDNLGIVKEQLRLHARTLENVGRMINTAHKYAMPNYKYDLLEMSVDWLFLAKYCGNLETVLDFGAGCGRQVVGSVHNLPNFKNYIGIDASLNGYVTQNAFYNTFALMKDLEFCDLLDYRSSDIQIDVKSVLQQKNTIVHFPAWTDYSLIKNRSIDLILACHVHNELSRSDFLRLMELVDTKLSDEGVFYVRSELGIWGDDSYEDKVKYHAIDPVKYLSDRDVTVIETEYFGGFMTTIFARTGSKFATQVNPKEKNTISKLFETITRPINKSIRGKDAPITFMQVKDKLGIPTDQVKENQKGIPMISSFKEAAFYCAAKYAFDEIGRTLDHYGSLQFIDEGFMVGRNVLKHYVMENEEGTLTEISNVADLDVSKPLVINSVDYHKHENQLPAGAYKTRLHYTYPFVIFLPDPFDLETVELIS